MVLALAIVLQEMFPGLRSVPSLDCLYWIGIDSLAAPA